MAYMDQDKKAKIAAALKQVVPAGWKYSLAVRNHSTIVMTIAAAPFNLIAAFKGSEYFDPATASYTDVNPYHYRNHLDDECVADVFEKIFECLNIDNFDNSDPMTDYFHVGHYAELRVGAWDRGFICTAKEEAVA